MMVNSLKNSGLINIFIPPMARVLATALVVMLCFVSLHQLQGQSFTYSSTYNLSPGGTFTQGVDVRATTGVRSRGGMFFNNDGSVLYVLGINEGIVFQFNLSIPFDATTATYDPATGEALNVNNNATNIDLYGAAYNNDGTKLFLGDDENENVVEYTLTTPYDVSSATNYRVVINTLLVSDMRSIRFNDIGTEFYILHRLAAGTAIYRYTLTTPFDLTTATPITTPVIQTNYIGSDFLFNGTGTQVFIVERGSSIKTTTLTTPYDLSTAIDPGVNQGLISGGDFPEPTGPSVMTFNNTGTKWYYIPSGGSGGTINSVWEYTSNNTNIESFVETAQNMGAVETRNPIIITVNGGFTFVGAIGQDLAPIGNMGISNDPPGLTPVLILISSTELSFSFRGQALNHEDSDDVADLLFSFESDAFNENTARTVRNDSSGIGIDFLNNPISVLNTGSLLSGVDLVRIADNVEAATITLQLKDDTGNDVLLGGVSVTFSTTFGNLSASTVTTNALGNVSVTLTSAAVGMANVTATIDDDLNAATPEEEVVNGSPVVVTFTPTDSDGDGVTDDIDICSGFDDNMDSDGDGVPDGCDSDDDNDGILDEIECPLIITGNATGTGAFVSNLSVVDWSFNGNFNDGVQIGDDVVVTMTDGSVIEIRVVNITNQNQANELRPANIPLLINAPLNGLYSGSNLVLYDSIPNFYISYSITFSITVLQGNPAQPDLFIADGERTDNGETTRIQTNGTPWVVAENLSPNTGLIENGVGTNDLSFQDSNAGANLYRSNGASLFTWEIFSNPNGTIGLQGLFMAFSRSSACDADRDGIPNNLDIDSDNDGIADIIEAGGVDANNDGRVDYPTVGDPTTMVDVDGDGVADALDHIDNGSGATEVTNGTPLPLPDTDNDGLVDFQDIDADNDGIIDNIEAQTTAGYLPPTGVDTDGDGLDNAYDIDSGSIGITPTNTGGSALPDYRDTNSDGDLESDNIEAYDLNNDGISETVLSGNDADNDGLDDAFDTVDLTVTSIDNASNGGTLPTDFPDVDAPGNDRDWREFVIGVELLKRDIFNDENGDGRIQAGETITYIFTVTNIGDVDITGISINDPTVTVIGGPLALLSAKAVDNTTFTASYTITATDLINGNVTNTATVSATGPNGGSLTDISDDPDNPADIDSEGDGEADDPTVLTIDSFEPEIVFIKTALNAASSSNIAGGTINLGDQFNYRIQLQNIGNDDASNIELTDMLPPGVDFISSSLAGTTYDTATRTLSITVADSSMEAGDPLLNIDILVEVSNNCNDFRDACAGMIENQANLRYDGVNSPVANVMVASYERLADYLADSPGPVTVNIDLSSCTFDRNEIICNNSLDISAGSGFTNYEWRDAGNNVIGNTQSITVITPGVYTVTKTNTPPNTCPNSTEIINVIPFGNDPHPLAAVVSDFDIDVKTCANDGSQKYEIFLCGASATRLVETNFVNIQSIQWQLLDQTSCSINTSPGCATLNSACTWNTLSTSANYSVADQGQYRILITYPNGCFRFFYFDVFKNPLDPTPISENIICGNPGSITITGVGTDYEFSIDNGTTWQNSNVFSITAAGSYDVLTRQITPAVFGCVFELPNIIISEEDIDVDTFVVDQVCNINGNIRFQVNGVGPSYVYTLSQGGSTVAVFGPTNDNDHTFANLAPGDYDIEITNSDGCLYNNPTAITVADYPDLSVSAITTQNITCEDGQITATITGGVGPYNYSIDGGITQQISNVFPINTAGNYTITVEDVNGCIATSNVTNVQQLTLPVVTFNNTQVQCKGENSGLIQVVITGGTGYTIDYSIDNGVTYQTSAIFPGLTAGNYNIIVRASNGPAQCLQTFMQTITEPTDFLIGLAELTQQLDCNSVTNDAIIEIQGASGGTAPFEYSIDGITFTNSTVFENLGAGTYNNITIRDANACSVVLNTIIVSPRDEPTDLDFNISAPMCNTGNSIVFDLTVDSVTGGVPFVTPPLNDPAQGYYNYEIIAGPTGIGTMLTDGDTTFTDLVAGTYTIEVSDFGQCTYSENVTIANVPQISVITQKISDISCFNSSDGRFNFTVSNSAQYDYVISGGPVALFGNNINRNTPIPATNLSAGIYEVRVTDDATGCTAMASITIESPTAPLAFDMGNEIVTTPVSCLFPNNGGTATANVVGGWQGYSYTLTPIAPAGIPIGPQPDSFFENLQPGDYEISVTDINGCTVVENFTLAPAVIPTVSINTPSSDFCFDGTDQASITVDASSTRPGATFSFREGTNPYTPGTTATSNTFTNLTPGSYTFFAQDELGCENSISFTIEPQLSTTAVLTKDLDCTATPDAQITVTIANGYPDGGGNYMYDIILDPSGSNTLVADDAISTGNTIIHDTNIAGDYRFDITDAQGCTVQSTIVTVTPNSSPIFSIPVATTTDVACNGESTGVIAVNSIMGNGPFEYRLLDTGNTEIRPFQTNNTFSGLAAGNYLVEVRDAKQCTQNSTTIILIESAAINSNSTTRDIDCIGGFPDGEITVNASGGTAPYMYTISNPIAGLTFNHDTSTSGNLFTVTPSFGNFNIRIVDANNCEFTETVTVGEGPDVLNFIPGPPRCLAGQGEITVQADNSSGILSAGPFYFALSPAPAFDPTDPNWFLQDPGVGVPQFTFNSITNPNISLNPGVTYTFVVYDQGTGCEYFEEATIPITGMTNMVTSIDRITPESCFGFGDASVEFTYSMYSGTQIDYEIINLLTGASTGLTGSTTAANPGDSFTQTLTGTTANPLGPGRYYVLFSENTPMGCVIASSNFDITGSPALLEVSATITDNDIACTLAPNFEGQITVQGRFGTGPYEYIVEADPSPAPIVPPMETDVRWDAQTIWDNLEGGNYLVWVKDALNCIQQAAAAAVVPTDSAPTINPSIVNVCATEGQFEISVDFTDAMSVGVPPYQISLNGGSFQNQMLSFGNPYIISNLFSGAYTINLRDANGCETGDLPITIISPLAYSAAVTSQPLCTNPGNTPIIGGLVTMTPSGGSGTQTYELWNATNTAPEILGQMIDNAANTISNIPPGTYTVRVIDAGPTACVQSIPVTLDSPAIPSLTSLVTNVLCNGDSTGRIISSLNIGATAMLNPPYQYELYDSEMTFNPALQTLRAGPQSSSNFSGLPAGFYRVRVISSRGCEAYDDIEITAPAPLDAQVTVSPYTCNANNEGNLATVTVNIDPLGLGNIGTPPYIYSFNGTSFVSNNTIDIPHMSVAQEITIRVQDANGCELIADDGINAIGSVTIPPIQKVSATISNPTASRLSCIATEDIAITIANGSGNYTVIEQPSGALITTPGDIRLNAPGLYTYFITDTTTSCTASVSYTVNPFDEGTVTAINLDNISCDGFANGGIQIDVQGYTGPYTYTVVDNLTGTPIPIPTATGSGMAPGTLDILDISAGVYRVEISQGAFPNCSPVSSGSISIAPPPAPLVVTASRTNTPTCVPGNDGQITATVSGGRSPYELQLENSLGVVIPGFDFATNGNNIVFSNLTSGDYQVRVRDANGCTEPPSNVVSIPVANSITASGIVSNPLACFGDNDAEITITASGGIGTSFNYILNNVDTGISQAAQSSPVFNNLLAGNYTVTVTDGFGCDATTAVLPVINPVEITTTLTTLDDVTCVNLGQVRLRLSAFGGTLPYRYSTNPTGPFIPMVGNQVDINVSPGVYQYYIQDVNNCISNASSQITIQPVVPLDITLNVQESTLFINCVGESSGVLSVETSGGLGNNSFELFDVDPATTGATPIQGPFTQGVFNRLPAGTTYYVVANSSNDCTDTLGPITITEPANAITVDSLNLVDVECNSENSGSANIIVSGGTPPYTYIISSDPLRTVTNPLFENLTAGSYTVIATDSLGCFVEQAFDITEPLPIDAVLTIDNQEICLEDNDASISLNITGGTPPYSISINDQNGIYNTIVGDSTTIGMLDGNQSFTIYVRDANMCSAFSNTVTLDAPIDLTASTITTSYNCDQTYDITIGVDAQYTNDVMYSIDGGVNFQLSNVFANLPSGSTYDFQIMHSSGCAFGDDEPFGITLDIFPDVSIEIEQSSIDELVAQGNDGIAPYEYSIDGITFVSDNVFSVTETGEYVVTVRDAIGCTAQTTINFEYIAMIAPNFFTPNGDGQNDYWIPQGLEFFPNAQIKIFDRYGRLLKEFRGNIAPGWDGYYENIELPSGDYWYIIQLNDGSGSDLKGHFNLYR